MIQNWGVLRARIALMVTASVANGLRKHLDPDSPWRLNLIKEVADHINGDNTIALAAIEGSVLDLGQKITALEAELHQIRRGH